MTYLLRRSDAVLDRAVCFLGRFLPKLGGAFGAAFFLSGHGEWLAAAARAAGRLLCALPSERQNVFCFWDRYAFRLDLAGL